MLNTKKIKANQDLLVHQIKDIYIFFQKAVKKVTKND